MPGDAEQALPPLRDRLRAALPAALKARDRTAVAALRSALAAIDNAEAVDASDVHAGAIEASAPGPGAAERPRRELTESDIDDIVRTTGLAVRAVLRALPLIEMTSARKL